MGATMATMLKGAANNLRCRLICVRGLSDHAAVAPLGKLIDCTTGPGFVLPESNNESKTPKIELPSPYFAGSMDLMAVPKRKVSFGTLIWLLLSPFSGLFGGFLHELFVDLSIWFFQNRSILSYVAYQLGFHLISKLNSKCFYS